MAPLLSRRHLSDRDRLAWLRLLRSENVGPRTFRELVDHFGSARAAIEALPDLARHGGRQALRLASQDDAEREMERIVAIGARLVAPGEPGYPPRLCVIDDAPPLLAVKGRIEIAARPMIAIVGARQASALGRRMAEMLAADLGASGHVIASGLARGIDTAAHRAALATGTVAAVAGGLDIVYPPENAALQQAIAETGLVVSEQPPGTQPGARHFPRRNRLISGMSAGVAVIEAARRSGSLITARMALEQGREVFAVPGSPLDPRAEGCNRLIRDGATLTRSAQDIIEVLSPMLRHIESTGEDNTLAETDRIQAGVAAQGRLAPDDAARRSVGELLSVSPVSIDEIIRQSGVGARAVAVVLLEMEVAGRVIRHAGQLVSLRPPDRDEES